MKRLVSFLVSSWWHSPLCLLLCAGLWCGTGFIVAATKSHALLDACNILGRAGVVGFGLFLSIGLAAVVRAFVLRRWGWAAATFLATGVCVLLSLLAALEMTFGISDDARFRHAATAVNGEVPRPSAALESRAENAESESHAESAEGAEPEPHAESAEDAE